MRIQILTKLATVVTLLSVAHPAVAQPHHYHGNNAYNQNNKLVRKIQKTMRQQQRRNRQARWDWNRHNWNDQRDYMRNNWQARRNRMNAAQRAQMDAQLRQQWLAYHNNSWNGGYSWNQYNDPRFFDYLHNNNPSLINTLRSVLGF